MRERADELKGEVRQMFGADRAMSVPGMVNLVDELERLGVDNHFREEIKAALRRIHSEGLDVGMSNDLYIVTLRFFCLGNMAFGYLQVSI
jgi:ABC-type branched-subunit amino acid transport system ATPase component